MNFDMIHNMELHRYEFHHPILLALTINLKTWMYFTGMSKIHRVKMD